MDKEKAPEEETHIEIREEGKPESAKEGTSDKITYGGNDKHFVIALCILIIVVGAFFASQHFMKKGPETKYEVVTYNGFQFVKIADLWHFNWEKDGQTYVVALQYHPQQVEDVPIYGETDERFRQQHIYITHNPAESGLSYVALATTELTASLVGTQNLEIEGACAENKTADCAAAPIINCDNTNSSVIYIKEADETRVDLNGNCMTIQGKEMELLRATEKVLYIWYNIIT